MALPTQSATFFLLTSLTKQSCSNRDRYESDFVSPSSTKRDSRGAGFGLSLSCDDSFWVTSDVLR
jgi:hypothetical protein